MKIAELNDMISDVCPIFGINSNGVIWFKSEATEEQKSAAQAVMNSHLGDINLDEFMFPKL